MYLIWNGTRSSALLGGARDAEHVDSADWATNEAVNAL